MSRIPRTHASPLPPAASEGAWRRDPQRLPPLDLLVTFEAAARRLSFTAAGDEGALTQSAVSRRVRALEDDLGTPLFERGHRSLVLTEAGHELYRTCREVLDRLRATAGRLRAPSARTVVTLTTMPGLASLWLVPRLSRLLQLQPDIDVRIDVGYALRDLEAEGIDIGIRYLKAGRSAGRRLFAELVLPVCSPELRATADLEQAVLLSLVAEADRSVLTDWEPWFRAMRIDDPGRRRVLSFGSYDDVVRAAVLGQGIALGRRPIVDELLTSGKLVPAFGDVSDAVASACGWYVVTNALSRSPAAARVADWLLAEAAATRGAGAIPARSG